MFGGEGNFKILKAVKCQFQYFFTALPAWLKKKHFISRKFINSFADIFEGFQICKQARFTKRLILMTELKFEFSGMFGKPPALYIQTLAFLNIKKQQLEKNLKNSGEKVLKNITTQL